MKKLKYTDEDLIKIIQEKAKELNRVLKCRDIKQCSIIKDRFESWNKALAKAGFEVNVKTNLTKEICINAIIDFYNKNKKSPTVQDFYDDRNLPDPTAIVKKLKMSWNEILKSLNLPINCEKSEFINLDDKNLLLIIKEKLKEYNTTFLKEYDNKRDKNLPSGDYLAERFGNWSLMLGKLGFKKNINSISEEFLLKVMYKFYLKYNKTPTQTSFSALYYEQIKKKIGWNNALKKLNIKINKEQNKCEMTKEEILQEIIRLSKLIGDTLTAIYQGNV